MSLPILISILEFIIYSLVAKLSFVSLPYSLGLGSLRVQSINEMKLIA